MLRHTPKPFNPILANIFPMFFVNLTKGTTFDELIGEENKKLGWYVFNVVKLPAFFLSILSNGCLEAFILFSTSLN